MKTQCSILHFQEVIGESVMARWDAEFFHPNVLDAKQQIRSLRYSTLRRLGAAIVHPVEIQRQYVADGIQILLAQNIRDNYMDFSNVVYMPVDAEQYIAANRLVEGDVALTRSGANYGQCAPYLGEPERIFACADDLVIKNSQISATYLSTYLNTKYGKSLIECCKYGSAQPHIAPQVLYDIPIYIPSAIFADSVSDIVQYAFEIQQDSGALYDDAQHILISEVGLKDWQPQPQPESVRSFSDAWGAGRMDAEYFRPQYDEITAAIQNYAGGYAALGDLVYTIKGVEVGSGAYLDAGIPFVRVSNLTPFAISEEKYISDELYAQIRHHQPRQGEILLTKDATPGIAHYLREPPPPMIAAGGILRLRLKDADRVNGDYLTLALNSTLTRMQAERDAGGSVIRHWRPDQIAAALIPILPPAIQSQIQSAVAESFALRQLSRQLLDCAKRGVEIAIAQGETTALAWLESERAALL